MLTLIPSDEAARRLRQVGAMCLALGFAAGVAFWFHMAAGAAAEPAPTIDELLHKLCHWPKHPGEGMFVGLDGEGRRYCWELAR